MNMDMERAQAVPLDRLWVKIFADGASLDEIKALAHNPLIKGFTTNPTLMRKAGVTDYAEFAHDVLAVIPSDKCVSFEVFADEPAEMYRQAREISFWGPNVYVKIPVTNTQGQFQGGLIKQLSKEGAKLNVTAVLSFDQARRVIDVLDPFTPSIVSIFAGRIFDAGVDAEILISHAVGYAKCHHPKLKVLWASPRHPYDIIRANRSGCKIITVTKDMLAKAEMFGRDLDKYSLETVEMFFKDALAAGYKI